MTGKAGEWIRQQIRHIRSLARVVPHGHSEAMGLRETQAADVFITQKWLQNRVWLLSSTHGLLSWFRHGLPWLARTSHSRDIVRLG
jgi:hypothetical protein